MFANAVQCTSCIYLGVVDPVAPGEDHEAGGEQHPGHDVNLLGLELELFQPMDEVLLSLLQTKVEGVNCGLFNLANSMLVKVNNLSKAVNISVVLVCGTLAWAANPEYKIYAAISVFSGSSVELPLASCFDGIDPLHQK